MAGDTIGELGQHHRIILIARAVTTQAPAHVHFLGFSHRHLADFRMAILAVETGCNMRTMTVINKIGEQRHRYPRDLFIAVYVGVQLVQLGTGLGNILVAAITLGNGWQPG
jgi:hypothetical protein